MAEAFASRGPGNGRLDRLQGPIPLGEIFACMGVGMGRHFPAGLLSTVTQGEAAGAGPQLQVGVRGAFAEAGA
jgi:hypothetical protein